jgi:hypothetical protein
MTGDLVRLYSPLYVIMDLKEINFFIILLDGDHFMKMHKSKLLHVESDVEYKRKKQKMFSTSKDEEIHKKDN